MRITSQGFVLLEVVVTIGVLSVIFFLGLGVITSYQRGTVKQGARAVEQAMQQAARRARDGVNATSWGVYIPYDIVTRKASEIIIFSGTSYAGRDINKDISFPVSTSLRFSSVKATPASAGNDHEFVFSYLQGNVTNVGTIVLDYFGESTTIYFYPDALPVSEPL